MAVEGDSKVGIYFMGLIFVGLAIGGIVGVNQTKAYWTNFCVERQDIEECRLIQTEPQKAIVALIKLGDQYGSHAAIPATPPKEAEKKSN
jgi:hypothetical protein